MRVSIDWLKQYVTVTESPAAVAKRLTGVGLVVETIQPLNPGVRGVIVGQVEALAKHPNADTLWVCQVDVGSPAAKLQVVTGAQNVRAGDRVPVAVPGATIAGGKELGVTNLRGVESHGMLCSPDELGIDEGHDGILILPPDVPIGADCVDLLGLDDTVLELDLTANYASHAQTLVGVAQEYAAATGQQVRWPQPQVAEAPGASVSERIQVQIAAPDLCYRFSGRMIEGVRIMASPPWMQKRLRAAGMRPINNIVDITNYVMLELGQPLHAYDYDQIGGKLLSARRAGNGEGLVTLDGQQRVLDEHVLVIADAAQPQGMAGVMGGGDSEVTDATTTIFLEAASFNNINNRRTARRFNLPSEAASRFTKGVDPSGTVRALDRAIALMAELGGGRVVPGTVDNYPRPFVPRVIPGRMSRLRTIMGLEVGMKQAVVHLEGLGFKVLAGEEIFADLPDPGAGPVWAAAHQVSPVPADPAAHAGWAGALKAEIRRAGDLVRKWAADEAEIILAVVPTRRLDLGIEEDLAEEIAREVGYDQIRATLPRGDASRGGRSRLAEVGLAVRHTLAGAGLDEVVTYGLVHPRVYDKLRFPAGHMHRRYLTLANPLYDERSTLRTTLVPSLLDVLQHNVNRQVRDLKVFEIGKVYWPEAGQQLPAERWFLGLAATGNVQAKGWDTPARPADFYYLKGHVESLLDALGIRKYRWLPAEVPFLHPGRTAKLEVQGRWAGVVGELHPEVQAGWDLPDRTYAANLDLAVLVDATVDIRPYRAVPRFPSAVRDVSFVIGTDVPAETLAGTIRATAGDLLEEVRLFDLYQGAPVPEGKRSLAYSLTYRAADHTLTDAEVDQVHGVVRKALAALGADLRS